MVSRRGRLNLEKASHFSDTEGILAIEVRAIVQYLTKWFSIICNYGFSVFVFSLVAVVEDLTRTGGLLIVKRAKYRCIICARLCADVLVVCPTLGVVHPVPLKI